MEYRDLVRMHQADLHREARQWRLDSRAPQRPARRAVRAAVSWLAHASRS